MGQIKALGLGGHYSPDQSRQKTEYIVMERALQRVLAFRGRTIDDVVNDPIVKNDILGYWKVIKQIERRSEMLDLERQWNGLGRRL
jgi:hypothetical protein